MLWEASARPLSVSATHFPHANDIVFRTHWPVTMIGLDITYTSGMDKACLDELELRGGKAGHFLNQTNQGYMVFNN